MYDLHVNGKKASFFILRDKALSIKCQLIGNLITSLEYCSTAAALFVVSLALFLVIVVNRFNNHL